MDNQQIFSTHTNKTYLANDLQTIVKGDADCDFDGEFIVFDVETTGLNAKHDRITEIAAHKINCGKIVDEFSMLVNPGIAIPQHIERLTGITNEMVKNAETIDEVLPYFIDFCTDSVMVGYNINFLMAFIKQSVARLGITYNPSTVDILSLSRAILPDLEKHNLKTLCGFFDIELKENLSLPENNRMQVKVFFQLCQIMREHGITNVADINSLIDNVK